MTQEVRIEGLNVENALALAARLRERADGLPQDAEDIPLASNGEPLSLHNVMFIFSSRYECGTVGCIAGELAIWERERGATEFRPLHVFLGLDYYADYEDEDPDSQDKVIYLEDWTSDAHRERFLATPLLAERLRIMASYLTWLTGNG